MLEDTTIKYLEDQKKSDFNFNNVNKLELTYELISNIGDVDPYLRDDVIYPCLGHLLHDSHLDKLDLIKITELLISKDYLTYDMENLFENSTLKRTFTALQIVILLYVHNRDNIFSKDTIKSIFNNVLNYYINETDLRGYDEKIGWIHSVAHSADMFAQLVKCKELNRIEFEDMMNAISLKFRVNSYTYVSDEDERTVTAIYSLLEREIMTVEFMVEWVNQIGNYQRPKKYPEVYRINSNVKNLLRSLYFRLLNDDKCNYLTEEIKLVLETKVKLR